MITKSLQFSVRGFGILLLAQSILFAMGTAGPAQAGEAVPWVSAMEGKPDTLSLKHEGGEWFQATLNTPITKGDDLYLEAGGRAEHERVAAEQKGVAALFDAHGCAGDGSPF